MIGASSYTIIFDNNLTQIPVDTLGNMNQHITTSGTTVHMYAIANYYHPSNGEYFMTSPSSDTKQFTKLRAPEFSEAAFTNSHFNWIAPTNINSLEYTPNYVVYNGNKLAYNIGTVGTSMNISEFPSGVNYTFYVRAIGDGVNYINSEFSEAISIQKLGIPQVTIDQDEYVWSNITGATAYAVYVDGVLSDIKYHFSGNVNRFKPYFSELKSYDVKVYAIGDGGYNSIDSAPFELTQFTKQLTLPGFSFSYTGPFYTLDGKITLTITTPTANASGYVYIIGGHEQTQNNLSHEFTPPGAGVFTLSIYALGGKIDQEGYYYIDSLPTGGNSNYQLTILPAPNQSLIQVSLDGRISWGTVSGAYGYEYELIWDGGSAIITNTTTRTYVDVDLSQYTNLKVRVRVVGNGTKVIGSEWIESEFNLSND